MKISMELIDWMDSHETSYVWQSSVWIILRTLGKALPWQTT